MPTEFVVEKQTVQSRDEKTHERTPVLEDVFSSGWKRMYLDPFFAVEVRGATNLVGVDLGGTCDPYFIIQGENAKGEKVTLQSKKVF